jgi:hypothetical protein
MMIRIAALASLCCSSVLVANGFSLPVSQNKPFPPARLQSRQIHSTQLSSTVSSNPDLIPGIESIDGINSKITETLGSLRETPYFRLYAVDILASCEYIPQELFECYTESCEIYPVDDDEVSNVISMYSATASRQLNS